MHTMKSYYCLSRSWTFIFQDFSKLRKLIPENFEITTGGSSYKPIRAILSLGK